MSKEIVYLIAEPGTGKTFNGYVQYTICCCEYLVNDFRKEERMKEWCDRWENNFGSIYFVPYTVILFCFANVSILFLVIIYR